MRKYAVAQGVRRNPAAWRRGFLGFAVSLGLPCYFALLIASLALGSDPTGRSAADSPLARALQLLALGLFVVSMGMERVLEGRKGAIWTTSRSMRILWLIFVAWCLCSCLWSISTVTTGLYTMLLSILIASMVQFWRRNDGELGKSVELATFALMAGTAILFVALPKHGRQLGGITPNAIGHIGLTIAFFASISKRKLVPLLGLLVATGLMVYSQSRTTFGSLIIFAALRYGALTWVTNATRARITLVVLGFSAAIGLLLSGPIVSRMSTATSSALGVSSAARGANSGFTGRARHWAEGLDMLQGHELGGYGFRTRSVGEAATQSDVSGDATNAHSGLLNAALDLGLLGFLCYVVIYVASVVVLTLQLGQSYQARKTSALAFIIAFVPCLLVEPNYLNFSASSSFTLLLCLMLPLANGGYLADTAVARRRPFRSIAGARAHTGRLAGEVGDIVRS